MRISFRIWTLGVWHISIVVAIIAVVLYLLTDSQLLLTIAIIFGVATIIFWSLRERVFLILRKPSAASERALRVLDLLGFEYASKNGQLQVPKVDSRYSLHSVGLGTILLIRPSPTTKEQRYLRDSILKYQKQS